MSLLYSEFKLRDVKFKNRVFVSPMCQYSAVDGVPNDWHLVHLGTRAVGGAALVMAEATGVNPEGRISPGDLGLWNNDQLNAFKRITKFISEHDSVPAIQLAHAGRKASTNVPWKTPRVLGTDAGGWPTVAPSAVAFDQGYAEPLALSPAQMKKVLNDFTAAAERALEAGFKVIEVHMAHGYLLNEFLSPLSNRRDDEYGGSVENRMRFPLEVAGAVRNVLPKGSPMFVRISATDWVDGGWTLEDSVVFCKKLKELGCDLIDCSSGGSSMHAKIPNEPGYQVHLASGIRKRAGIPTGAVGLITEASQAEEILRRGDADVIFLARQLLRDPYWPLHSARKLGDDTLWPKQYLRAKPV